MKKPKIFRIRSRWVALLVVAIIAAACSGDTAVTTTTGGGAETTTSGATGETSTTADSGGSDTAEKVRLSISVDQGTLSPFNFVTNELLDLVWATLIINDTDNVLHGLVASEWTVSDDRLTYTFTLREGMTFHDGEPITVDDVVFSFNYSAEKGYLPSLSRVIESVEATDDRTVVLTLNELQPDFEQDTLSGLEVIPEHIFKDIDDPATAGLEASVGSGPYKITEHTEDGSYTLVAHENYAPGAPKVDVIELSVIPQPATAFSALLSGEIDAASVPVPVNLIPQLEGAEGVELIKSPNFAPELIILNAQLPGLDRTEVRQAITKAIDVDELMAVVALGDAVPPNAGYLHPDSPLVTDPIAHVFDVTEAVNLLDGISATPGSDGIRTLDGERLSFSLLVDADNANSIRNAELVQGMLAEVGIEVIVETTDYVTLNDRMWPGYDVANGRDFDMGIYPWSPLVSIRAGRFGGLVQSDPARGVLNLGGFSDPETDALVAELDAAATPEDKAAAIQAISEKMAELVPFVILYYPNNTYAYRGDVYGGWENRAGFGPVNTNSFVDYNDW